jgi:hypothetical protein
VDVQDSSHAQNNREMVKVAPVIQKTAEKAQKRKKDEVRIPSAVEKQEKDQVSIAPTAVKSNVSPGAATPPPMLVPSMPSKPQQKKSTKVVVVAKQSSSAQLLPRRPKPAPN